MILNMNPSKAEYYEHEKNIIGIALIENNSYWYDCFNTIIPGMFAYKPNQLVWQSILEMRSSKKPIDLITMSFHVKKKYSKNDFPNENPISYISSLSSNITSTDEAIVNRYVGYLKKEYIQRKSVETFQSAIKKIINEDAIPSRLAKVCFDYITKVEENSFDVQAKNDSFSEHVKNALNHFKDIESGKIEPFIKTQYEQLDKVINGLTLTDLIVIGARPGMGKTALAVCIAKNVASKGVPVGIFSLEMSANQIVNRLVSSQSMVNTQLIQDPTKMTDNDKVKYHTAAGDLSSLPIYIDDRSRIIVEQIIDKIRLYIKKYGVKVVIIDYLQLISNSLESRVIREQQVSHISRSLKITAKQENICIIALSQLSREVDKRSDKRPIISDLRESGAIEQDADMIIFLYRPAYYGIHYNNDEDLTYVLELVVAKNRHGSTQSVYLYFDDVTTTVVDSKLKIVKYQESQINSQIKAPF